MPGQLRYFKYLLFVMSTVAILHFKSDYSNSCYPSDMAEQSPSKKLRNQIKGVLCEVSPIKDHKKPYFNAILQHEGEVSKVVAFRPEDHIHFQNAETTR